MRNFTWIITWFRATCRPFPLGIAIALGLLPSVRAAGDEQNSAPAPVLRVARPYPELKVPPTSNSTTSRPNQLQVQQGDTRAATTPASSRRGTATVPSSAQPTASTATTQTSPAKVTGPAKIPATLPGASNQASSDGWVAREMIGKRAPLTDPGHNQPAPTNNNMRQLATPPQPASTRPPAATPTATPAATSPAPAPASKLPIRESALPDNDEILQMPVAPLTGETTKALSDSAPEAPPSIINMPSSRRSRGGNVPPSLQLENVTPPTQTPPKSPLPVGDASTQASQKTQSTQSTQSTQPAKPSWQPADSGPIVGESLSQLESQPAVASPTKNSASGWAPKEKPSQRATSASPGWQSQPAEPQHEASPQAANVNVNVNADAADMSPALKRMLSELQGMKPVARMAPANEAKPEANPTPTPNSFPSDSTAADSQVTDLRTTDPVVAEPMADESMIDEPTAALQQIVEPEVVTPEAVPPTVIEPEITESFESQWRETEPIAVEPEAPVAEGTRAQPSQTNPLARPELAEPRRNIEVSSDSIIGDLSHDLSNNLDEMADDAVSNSDETASEEEALPMLSGPKTLDIPIRRPAINADSSRSASSSSSSSSSEVSSRRTNSGLQSPSRSLSRDSQNLQDQLERFERGDASLPGSSQVEPDLDSLDSAAEPLDSQFRPKTAQAVPQRKAAVISAASQRLDQPIRQALVHYYQRPEKAAQRTPWGMLHAILPFDLDANVDANRRYNAIAYLAGNNPNRNLRMLTVTRGGRLVARSGVGLQGHQAQMLAIFAQVGVPADYPLYVSNRKFIMNDLVKTEMLACKAGEELTFTLIGLSHYLPTDTKWRAADGQNWDFERLLSEEMSQPVVGAACGGTHRLMGLSYALKQRKLEGLPVTGQWARAETYLKDFEEYAWQLQNRDGSFSTDWFEGRADNGDADRKIQTSGHILEWLLFVTEDDRLQDERVTRSVTFLTNQLLAGRTRELQVGPKGHALRALSVYHRRVFDSNRPWMSDAGQTASQPATTSQRR